MDGSATLELNLLPGARELLQTHAAELPQRDDLCGAFCAALALGAAGIEQHEGEPADQDAVARAAGTVVSRIPDLSALPHGERGRRDYRIAPPLIDDASVSGTNCAGVLRGIERVSGGQLAAIPYSGPWSAATLDALFDALATLVRPATLIANVATRHLWGSAPSVRALLAYLLDGIDEAPPPDWDVGHFVCVFARTSGPGGALYGVADTYRSLGHARRAPAAARAAREGARACGHGARRDDRRRRERGRRQRAGGRREERPARGRLGQRHAKRRGAGVSSSDLVALVCCDLGGDRARALAAGGRAGGERRGGRRLGAGEPRADTARLAG